MSEDVDRAHGGPVRVRAARTGDVRAIRTLVEPLARQRGLVSKDAVAYYQGLQQFVVAEGDEWALAGCGARRVLWHDLAELRPLAVHHRFRGRGVGGALLEALVERARELGVG